MNSDTQNQIQADTPTLPPRFSSEVVTVETSSGRKFEITQLNALEQMQADSASKDATANIYARVAMSIVSVDGRKVLRAGVPANLQALLERLSGREIDEIAMAYARAFAPKLDRPGELKNESTPAA